MNIIEERENIERDIARLSMLNHKEGSYNYERMNSLKKYLETLRKPTNEEIKEYKNMSHIFLVFDKKTYNIMGIFDERIEADKLEITLNVKDVEIQIKELELSSYTNEELENLIFLKERKEKRLSYAEEEKYRFVTIYSRRNIPFKIVL